MTNSKSEVPTPRCIIIRHGQTEWSKSGQYTGLTDLPLTEYGEKQMRITGKYLFSNDEFVDPKQITYVFTSPRLRAKQTTELVLASIPAEQRKHIRIVEDDDLREWTYGDYEGLLTHEIMDLRKKRGLDKETPWVIWRDGCENGESSQQVGLRLSRVIARIQNLHKLHQEQGIPSDILVFAHGHSLRYFASLWFKLGVEKQCETEQEIKKRISYTDETVPYVKINSYRHLIGTPHLLLDAGGIGVLSYAHHKLDEPALALAGAFVPPIDEQSQHDPN